MAPFRAQKAPSFRETLATLARQAARSFEALGDALQGTEAGAFEAPVREPARIESAAAGEAALARVLGDFAGLAGKIAQESALFEAAPMPRGAQAARNIAKSADAVASALDALTAGRKTDAARRAFEARRAAAAAERLLRKALETTFAEEGPRGLKSRALLASLSTAADLAERAADTAAEMAIIE
jgi:hypothetical protein